MLAYTIKYEDFVNKDLVNNENIDSYNQDYLLEMSNNEKHVKEENNNKNLEVSIDSKLSKYVRFFLLCVNSFIQVYNTKTSSDIIEGLRSLYFSNVNFQLQNLLESCKRDELMDKIGNIILSSDMIKLSSDKFNKLTLKVICYIFSYYGYVPELIIKTIKYDKNYLFIGCLSKLNIDVLKTFICLKHKDLIIKGFGINNTLKMENFNKIKEDLQYQEIDTEEKLIYSLLAYNEKYKY